MEVVERVPEGANKLAKLFLVVAAVAVPGTAALFFRDHRVLAALGGELLVLVTAFIGKVWDKLEAEYIDYVAKWASPKIAALITRYRARYRRSIYFQHRTFDVKGLNTQGAFSLELDQVYVDLGLSPEAPHKVSADPLRKPDLAGERREVWHFLKNDRYRHLAILGAPGSGKTTLLKHVALALAGPRRKRPLLRTPVLLYLRDLQSGIPQLTLAGAIRQSLPERFEAPPGWIENELDNQRCLILFDGLDEVADAETRKKVAVWIERQIKQYDDTRFLVTSRPNGYLSNPLEGVTVLDVKPFTWEQVERFVANWYLATETVRAGKRDPGVEIQAESGARDLLKRLGASPALTDLAVNPLLLTMITTVHKERNSLPGRRVELYREICEVFLGKRQASKGIALDLTPAQKERVIEALGWHMMEHKLRVIQASSAEPVIAPVLSQVDPNLAPAKFLASVRDDSGLIIEQETGQVAFAHLTFQEYLASVHAKAQGLAAKLVALVEDSWWAETIRLYAAQNNATPIVEACVAGENRSVETIVLAVDCRDEGLEVSPDVRSRVEEIVVASLDSEDARRRGMAGEVLLKRYLRSMTRLSEGTYRSRELIPNAIYELFVREQPNFQPRHWSRRRFANGDGRKPVLGVTGIAAKRFCSWLSRQNSQWRFDLPTECFDPELGPQWVESFDGFRCCNLPSDWLVGVRRQLEKRLARADYATRMQRALGNADISLDAALDAARALARDLGLDRLARDLDLDRLARDLTRVPARALDRDLARALNVDRALVLDRTLARALDRARDVDLVPEELRAQARAYYPQVEALSLLLMSLWRAGSLTATAYGDVYLAAVIAQEQQAGNLPPNPAGIVCVRRRIQTVM